jgi:predicted DNA-binding protein YlxM (UPF0122 family)
MEAHDYSTKVTQAALSELRRSKLAAEISNTELGNSVNLTRQAIYKKFKKGDMKLTEFVSMSLRVGVKPSDIMRHSEERIEAGDINEAA